MVVELYAVAHLVVYPLCHIRAGHIGGSFVYCDGDTVYIPGQHLDFLRGLKLDYLAVDAQLELDYRFCARDSDEFDPRIL